MKKFSTIFTAVLHSVFLVYFLLSAQIASATTTPAIYNPGALTDWANTALTGRADVVMLGDSNQAFAGHGWDGGWIRAFRNQTGLYATGLMWAGENYGLGSGLGDRFGVLPVGGASIFSFTNAPAEVDTYAKFGSAQSQYLYLASGESHGARNWGLFLNSGGLDTTAPLKWWITDATFPSQVGTTTPGSYQPTVRFGSAGGYATIASFPTVLTQTPAGYGIRTAAYSIPANPNRTTDLQFLFTPYTFSTILHAPFMPIWSRLEQVGRNGVSVSTLFGYGGRTARYMSNVMQSASDNMLTTYFTDIRRLLPTPKKILVRINMGLNDRNETLPSVWHGITPGNSAAAFADNIAFTIERINHIWTINNWPANELTYLVDIGHAIAEPQDAFLAAYATSTVTLINTYPNLAVSDLSALFPASVMEANNYYSSPDHYHLTNPGYDALSAAEVDLILHPAPPINHAPVLNLIGNKFTLPKHLLQFDVTASDEDSGTLFLTASSTIPTGAQFSQISNGVARFSWTPTKNQIGNYPVTFTVRDIGGMTDSETININTQAATLEKVCADTGC